MVVLQPPATHGYPFRTTGGEGSCTGGGLKTHRVPQEGVFGTEYLSRTVEAYFEHRVPLKTRRVPQEPFYGTARRFCTGEAPFRYRIFKLIRVAQFGGC